MCVESTTLVRIAITIVVVINEKQLGVGQTRLLLMALDSTQLHGGSYQWNQHLSQLNYIVSITCGLACAISRRKERVIQCIVALQSESFMGS